MANPDIQLLIGAKGGTSPSGASAVEIRQALQAALGGKNGVKVNVRLTSNAANNLRQEIQKALNANGGIEVKLKGQIAGAVSKGSSGSTGGKQKSSELNEINSAYKALTDAEKKVAELKIGLAKIGEKSNPAEFAQMQQQLSAARQEQERLNARTEELKAKYPQLIEKSSEYTKHQAQAVKNANDIALAEARAADASQRAAEADKKRAVSSQQTAAAVKSSASLNVQNFEKYLQGVSAKGRMDFAGQINEIRELYRVAHDNANVSLTGANGELRSTYDILQDIAKVWDKILYLKCQSIRREALHSKRWAR